MTEVTVVTAFPEKGQQRICCHCRHQRHRLRNGGIGLAAPLVCLAVFGSGSFLLPSMGCILILLLALRKPIEKAEGTEAEKNGEEVGA